MSGVVRGAERSEEDKVNQERSILGNPSLFLLTTWILLLSAEHSKVRKKQPAHVYIMD
jgi:hypothetical protein